MHRESRDRRGAGAQAVRSRNARICGLMTSGCVIGAMCPRPGLRRTRHARQQVDEPLGHRTRRFGRRVAPQIEHRHVERGVGGRRRRVGEQRVEPAADVAHRRGDRRLAARRHRPEGAGAHPVSMKISAAPNSSPRAVASAAAEAARQMPCVRPTAADRRRHRRADERPSARRGRATRPGPDSRAPPAAPPRRRMNGRPGEAARRPGRAPVRAARLRPRGGARGRSATAGSCRRRSRRPRSRESDRRAGRRGCATGSTCWRSSAGRRLAVPCPTSRSRRPQVHAWL